MKSEADAHAVLQAPSSIDLLVNPALVSRLRPFSSLPRVCRATVGLIDDNLHPSNDPRRAATLISAHQSPRNDVESACSGVSMCTEQGGR